MSSPHGVPNQPAAAARRRALTNLPAQPARLVGRQHLVARVTDLLHQPEQRLVTLTGPAGVGKTRLALAVAGRLLSAFADGVWFIDLQEARQQQEVIAAIARVFELRETAAHHLLDTVLDFLRDREMLLVLDNFEQVLSAAPRVADLLAACTQVRLLVTSRAALRLRWEQDVDVPPLLVPPTAAAQSTRDEQTPMADVSPIHLDEDGRAGAVPGRPSNIVPLPITHSGLSPVVAAVLAYPAVELFVERARAASTSFAVDDETAVAISIICARLDGLPLAIELAAARVKLLSPHQLLARLDQRLPLLVSGPRDLPVRHQTLRAALTWSYELLTADEQRFFRCLGVFSGGWTMSGAAAVTEVDEAAVVNLLDTLVDHSLVRRDGGDSAEPRFRLLETMREFALAALQEHGELASARDRHAEYCMSFGTRESRRLAEVIDAAVLQRIDAEHDNLRAALGWFVDSGRLDPGLELAAALARFWTVRGYYGEGRDWYRRLLAGAGAQQPGVLHKAMGGAGTLAMMQGDYAEARRIYEQLLAIQERAGAAALSGALLFGLARATLSMGDYAGAATLLERSESLHRARGNLPGLAYALDDRGHVALGTGAYDAAAAYYSECLSLRRAGNDHQRTAVVLRNLGYLALRREGPAGARVFFEEALSLTANADRNDQSYHASLSTRLALERGDYDEARSHVERGLRLARDLGDQFGLVIALSDAALLELFTGDLDRARERALMLYSINPADGDPRIDESPAILLARLDTAAGNPAAALDRLAAALDEARAQGLRPRLATGLLAAAEAHLALGAHGQAATAMTEALHEGYAIGDVPALLRLIATAALLAGAWRRPVDACTLIAAHGTLNRRSGRPVHPSEQDRLQALTTSLAAALSARDYQLATAAGEQMDLEQAVSFALKLTSGRESTPVESAPLLPPAAERSQVPVPPVAASPTALPFGLTAREREVLRLLVAGRSNREIAEHLVITMATVERHITHIYTKLNVRGRARVTAIAIEHGII